MLADCPSRAAQPITNEETITAKAFFQMSQANTLSRPRYEPPTSPPPQPPRQSFRHKLDEFTPKTIVCLREGYGRAFLLNDLLAGLTVGVIALPLAMAFAINSGPGLTP